ncbi:EAL domain-containing protein [Azospirillum canadense]|uniref:EAL domain-containing protein n=1 Tax=Azospirillum canadense TaxID=403962 RepID=UPI0022276426|nr:EAL domain-containing protein [Azospirillum canadense]MCW2240476.1 sensor c-di-GMP phosphodiesterase-like protein [Azospirillum canadense]
MTAEAIPKATIPTVPWTPRSGVQKIMDMLLGVSLGSLVLAAAWEGIRTIVEQWMGLSMAEADVVSLLLVLAIAGAVARFVLHLADAVGLSRFSRAERAMLRRLQTAIARQDIAVVFQPIIDTRSRKIVGAEALARWALDGESVPPTVFIPLAERAGLIRQVTRHVTRSALTAAAYWNSLGYDVPVSINLSAEDLEDLTLPQWLHDLCVELGVPESCLRIELTETQSIRNFETTASAVARLRAWGAGVHLDDFGTGYASMSVLQRIPFSGIKIDRDFVVSARKNNAAASIIRASMSIANELGLEVVAEGIEDADTTAWLDSIGIHRQQGFHFARPMPPGDFTAFALASA